MPENRIGGGDHRAARKRDAPHRPDRPAGDQRRVPRGPTLRRGCFVRHRRGAVPITLSEQSDPRDRVAELPRACRLPSTGPGSAVSWRLELRIILAVSAIAAATGSVALSSMPTRDP